ncbi:hypothetical protein [Citrobacter sp. RHBSTW-00127]|uniref:hypothetical protein n=1 Tax=Citrobacter sp. RHBSTW-00127 TaxID=2742636 RepID=UPI0015E9844C|nr:hypothetical protein [Citrobacter sp. RHBSTW-00127]QLZ42288.1 hypothetical protein HV084_16515 [Citrobacter sp. RHBSTW-00127]
MGLCVLGDALLAKSRHQIEGDCVTVKFTALACENEAGNDEYMYWVELHDSEGNTVMKEVPPDFMIASDIYERLKTTLGPAVA